VEVDAAISISSAFDLVESEIRSAIFPSSRFIGIFSNSDTVYGIAVYYNGIITAPINYTNAIIAPKDYNIFVLPQFRIPVNRNATETNPDKSG